MREVDYNYEYPIPARYHGGEIKVRQMRADEMPEDGITYYCDVDGSIYKVGDVGFNLQ